MNFPEELLHLVWQLKLYGSKPLQTTSGETIKVLHQGILNKNAGPDFNNAKLQIDGTIWVGNVEIHIKASDWFLHQHHSDHSYDNVILHVVYENDKHVFRSDGSLIPVLIIKDLFPKSLLENYERLITSTNKFPCEKQIHLVDQLSIDGFLSRVMVERLLLKSSEIEAKLIELKGDWEETFYHFMAKSFGFKVNALPMEMLARSLPSQLFAKHKNNALQIESLIFGQAGFLNQKSEHEYLQQLKREYQFLKRKYALKPIDQSLWKFMRMRPQNFPTLRLAQFSALMHSTSNLFSKVLHHQDEMELQSLFEELPVNAFWKNHYHFNKAAESVGVQLGKSSIDIILTNTISVLLFTYGKVMDQYGFVSKALALLEKLPAENNAIIRLFTTAGISIQNALHAQALLQLKKNYCDEKKCLNCGIGIKILNKK